MMIDFPVRPRTLSILALGILLAAIPASLLAQSAEHEASGLEPDRGERSAASAAAPRLLGGVPAGGLLLVPESTNDRVMAFDPMTGDLIDANFIPADPDNLSTPIQAILNAAGDGILVSDQGDDLVQEYDLDGNFVGSFAPAGGVDTSILDNIRGIALRPNGNLLVTVGGGTNADSVAEFDTAGNYLGNFIAIGAGGLDNPFDVILRAADYLVSAIDTDIIHRFDLAGLPLTDLAPVDNFPEQVAETPSGNVLVGNFGGTQEGVVEFDAAGVLIGVYDPPSLGGYRGAYELGNGNILTTNGGGVHEIDRTGTLVETKIAGVSARFIEFVGDTSLIFADGFESGDTTSWSSSTSR